MLFLVSYCIKNVASAGLNKVSTVLPRMFQSTAAHNAQLNVIIDAILSDPGIVERCYNN